MIQICKIRYIKQNVRYMVANSRRHQHFQTSISVISGFFLRFSLLTKVAYRENQNYSEIKFYHIIQIQQKIKTHEKDIVCHFLPAIFGVVHNMNFVCKMSDHFSYVTV